VPLHTPFTSLLLAGLLAAPCARSVGPYDGNDGTRDDGGGNGGGGLEGGNGTRTSDRRVEIRGLDGYAGRTIYLALEDPSRGAVTQRDVFAISGQTVTLDWPDAFQRDEPGMLLHLYVDTDADGHCTGADRSWTLALGNDGGSGVVFVQFTGAEPPDRPTSCGVFL
jgi:hypothetical protein